MAVETTMIRVRKLFNMAQDGVVSSKLCDMLQNIQKSACEEEFWVAFLNHLQKGMIFYKTERAVERVMDFVAAFTTYNTVLKNRSGENVESSASENEEGEMMDPFLLKVLEFLVENHNSRDKGVRYRCCQLINKILNCMGEDATIDEEISDAIYECMMIRIKDKFPAIRIQAVLALVRLQDPEDDECPVIDAFLHSIKTDTNADVRKTILANIALSRKTLPCVLGRIRDVKELNRRCAFLTLAEKVSIRALTIAQRINVLTSGLNDRSKIVKQACGQLLKAWLRSYNHNIIKLLEALDTEGSPDCSKMMLELMFKDADIEKMQEYVKLLTEMAEEMENGVRIIAYSSLTPEVTFFWHMLCKHLKSRGTEGEALLQQMLPELTNFCKYIKGYTEKYFIDIDNSTPFDGKEGQQEFILEHLLNIVSLLDLSDEFGRKNLISLIHDLLATDLLPISLTPVLVSRYINSETNEVKFVQDLVETIADIKQPLTQVVTTAMKEKNRRLELQIARISVHLNECREDLENSIKSNDFHQAASLKDQIAALEKKKEEFETELKTPSQSEQQRIERDDPDTMLKCLTISSTMLSEIRKSGLNSTMLTLKDELIFEGVKNEDPFIRNEAVKCLGHMSLLDKSFAAQHLVLFLQVAQVDQELLQITAVQVIFDLFLMYGLEAFNMEETKQQAKSCDGETERDGKDDNGDEENTTIVSETPPDELEGNTDTNETKQADNAAESVLGIMMMFLEGESPDLRTTVAEGMAKLLISGRVVSAKILTRLILLWYNPITEDDTKLRHCLGVFLPLFAFERRTNQELIEETFIPVIKTLLNAPTTSPLSRVNVTNVIELLIQLTDIRNLRQYNTATMSGVESGTSVINNLGTYVHDSIAMKLANQIISDPEDADVKVLCKALNHLTICRKNTVTLQDLIELSNQMITALNNNRQVKKIVEKFQANLERLLTEESFVPNDQAVSENSEGTDDQTMGIPAASSVDTSKTSNDDTLTKSKVEDNENDGDTTITEKKPERRTTRSRDAKHKLSSSSSNEKVTSVSKRLKLQNSRTSINFHIDENRPEMDEDIEDDSSED